MSTRKTHTPIIDCDEIEIVQRQVAALIDENGYLQPEWLSANDWIVVPIWGDCDATPELALRAAAVARQAGQYWFISALPPGSRRSVASTGKPLPLYYRAPVSDTGLMDVSWEWVPLEEHVTTTEDSRFAIVNAVDTWYVVAGPQSLVEQLLGCTIEDAWAAFGAEDAPFDDIELPRIRAHLRQYSHFFGTDVRNTIGGEPL